MITFGTLFTESVKEVEDLNEQIQLLDEMPGANMDTRAVHKHLKKQGWSLTRSSGGHDVFTHPDAKHHIPVPRHRQLKAPLVRGILKQSQVHEEIEQLEEGRPSQRHPLEGHEYHRKTNAELEYIAKDAHKAAEAMKSHNTDAENKYRDQASDSATVRYFRQKNGMPNWYKKKYGHVNEEVVEEGVKSPGVGWMLKADPKLGAKVDANKKKFKAFKQNVGKKIEDKKDIKEDNVINTNAVNSVHAQPKKKETPEVERYVTGQSKQVAGTNVVASPRESVQEGVAMDIAKNAARRNAGLSENNDNTLSSYDKEDTPAKKTLSKTAGMVKDLATNAKAKAKGKKSDDTFQPEPELASNIVR